MMDSHDGRSMGAPTYQYRGPPPPPPPPQTTTTLFNRSNLMLVPSDFARWNQSSSSRSIFRPISSQHAYRSGAPQKWTIYGRTCRERKGGTPQRCGMRGRFLRGWGSTTSGDSGVPMAQTDNTFQHCGVQHRKNGSAEPARGRMIP